jgi:hypothetical protein
MHEDEFQRLQDKFHKLSSSFQTHENQIYQHKILLDIIQNQLTIINATMVNRELLNVTVGQVLSKVEHFHSQNTIKFEHVDAKLDLIKTDSLDPIRKAIYWAVGLILSGVVLAILNLVLNK